MNAEQRAFVVIAEFAVKPDRIAAFRQLAEHDAACSVRDEPGCRQFDVLQAPEDETRFVFYEVYDSRPAFDHHLRTPHLQRFREGLHRLVERELPVRFLSRDFPTPIAGAQTTRRSNFAAAPNQNE